MNKLKWIIFTVIVFSVIGGLVIYSKNAKQATQINVSNIDSASIQTGNNMNGNIADHVFGKADSKVTLLEYGDYQCPGCAQQHPKTKAVIEEYADKIRFVFRNFPLTSIHPNAKAAAAAVESAGIQGKYWEMHNKIYESQTSWESLSGTERNDFFNKLASEISLDTTKLNTDMGSAAIAAKINYDTALAKKDSVDATPYFFLNGTKIDSAIWNDSSKLKAALDAELEKNL